MRLTQIKLAGFKSFVDPTVIPVPSQLVGVVGPNGCGKSNIIDAVRWVLGETRASELRGESMQDVIFNGSGQRRPAGRASVELVFSNDAGRAAGQWSTYAEIAVRRVLTRDGASSYFINNQQVRRRDIHDLFLGTGLGARGYAIIGQGMINRLIEAKPEELRVYLEEAAGVSRYKERRRETENRLSDTRENLTRVEDIRRELDTQLEKLEAQAEVARHYRALQEEGERKQTFLWYVREQAAREEQRGRARETEQAQNELEAAIAALRAGETDLESRRQAHYAASDAVHTAQGKMYEANAQVSTLEAEIRHVVDSRNRLQARQAQLQAQMGEWQAQHEHCQSQIAATEDELETGAALAEEAQIAAVQAQDELPDIERQVREAAVRRDGLRVELSKLEQQLALSAQAQRDADRQLQDLAVRRERLEQESRGLERPDPQRLEQLRGECEVLEASLEEAQAVLAELEVRLPEADGARIQAQAGAQHEAQALARLEARHAALGKLQEDVEKQGALAPWLAKHELDSLPRLWRDLKVAPGWETALEASLRERMAALPVSRLDWVRAFVNDPPPARLAFYQLPASPSVPAAAAGLTPLASLLQLSDPLLRALLQDWLQGVFTAEDMEQALARRGSLPPGSVLVLRSGHIVDAHGVRFYAADSEQAGMLARRQELENLQKEARAQRLLADAAKDRVAQAEAVWRQVGESMGPARQRAAEVTRRLHDVQLEYTRMQQLAAQSGERAARLQEDLEELAALQEEWRGARAQAEERFESLDEALGEQQSRYADLEIADEGLAARADAARARLRELDRRAQEAQFAEKGLKARLDELRRNLQLAVEQVRRAGIEQEQLQQDLAVLDASAAQAGLQDALEARAAAEEELTRARIELDNLAGMLRSADEQRMVRERALDPLREKITALQLQEQAARLAVEQFAEQLDARQLVREALARELDALPPDWRKGNWLQSEVQRISRQVESLGAVNLAALEELTTARERKTFLDSQHADLLEAIDTLEDAIRRIDRETRQLLQETFNIVNGHFGELFPRLFGGGEAKLTMTGDEILDAGIQVMAQPPGKRNSTIHLLSGGEKALTATALVFALFKLNPAPFCLLDEVDAPLDDANTERYANLVSSMSDQTQFLFISHNKIAMQMAKQLVGVTMQEQGVSRIVAVDIDLAAKWADGSA
ncbi:chromosome segregation protein SMC [Kerstersia sp.]|uniref:chromosome segregation protein SMC n=1 Tax=Kerstersia sp. TaxID=1930783 RepID=UPI003F8E83C4